MKKMEEESGIKYNDVQRDEAEEIMGGVMTAPSSDSSEDEGILSKKKTRTKEREDAADRKQRFDAAREKVGMQDNVQSADSIAKDAMLNEGKVSEEPWDGDPEGEKENFVQEELYIHAKVSCKFYYSKAY